MIMKRVRLKHKKRINRWWLFGGTLFFVGVVTFLSILHISDKLTPTLLDLAEVKLNKYSTAIVNKAISQVLEDKIDTSELFSITKSADGEIQMLDFDPVVVNHVLNVATTVVQNNIRLLEEGELDAIGVYDLNLNDEEILNLREGIAVALPLGKVLGVTLLSNLGPKIPVRFHYIGDVNSNITTKITQYGINNALMEIGVHLEMTAQIYLPFTTSVKVLDCDIPIVIKMVQGVVPNFYSGAISKNSSIYSLPVE